MSVKSGRISPIIVVNLVVIFLITLPGYFLYFYNAGTGHAFGEIYKADGLHWNSMDETARAPYIAFAKSEGLKCALLMSAGLHIPFFLLILLTIGILKCSVSGKFRMLLRLSFFGVWAFGMLFLSLGIGYWGQAIRFPPSLGPAFIIYVVVGALFLAIIGFVKLYRVLVGIGCKTIENLPK
jgi:hypothetical protein